MSRLRLCSAALVLCGTSGCLLEPSIFCDDVRVAWGFEDHEISTADDVSAEPGLQIDIALFSALPEGKQAVLTITDEDDVETTHSPPAFVDADGRILFESVDVPTGSVLFTMRTSNDCREVESRNRRFVLDEEGTPVCELSFMPPTRPIEGLEPLRSYIAADDQDLVLPQVQVALRAFTGRSQMGIRLLLLNLETQTSTVEERTTNGDGEATFSVSFGQGEVAIRALCSNGPSDVPQSTATFPVLVDSIQPDCQLIEPSSRVTPGDDLDGNGANGIQVLAVAQTSDSSSVGLDAEFVVNGGAAETSVIGAAGQSTLEITVPSGPGAQDFSVTIPDLAGNKCTASASF